MTDDWVVSQNGMMRLRQITQTKCRECPGASGYQPPKEGAFTLQCEIGRKRSKSKCEP